MAIYHDANYAAHRDAWKRVGAQFLRLDPDFSDPSFWRTIDANLVIPEVISGLDDVIVIGPEEGRGETDGALDKLIVELSKQEIADLPEKVDLAERQREKDGKIAIDESVHDAISPVDDQIIHSSLM